MSINNIDDLLTECWCRDFEYGQICEWAYLFKLPTPTAEEYKNHCTEKDKEFEDFFNAENKS